MVPAQKIKTATQAAQHAERQAIDLQQSQGFEVVLVPLNDGAIRHRRVFHWHQLPQRLFGDHEAADMLGEVAWETTQLIEQHQEAA